MMQGVFNFRVGLMIGAALLLNICCSVRCSRMPFFSPERDRSVAASGSFRRAKAKTPGNCALVVTQYERTSVSDAIAVSFYVHVNDTNSKNNNNRRFVLVRNNRAKFLLGLPDDSEILSLNTLKHFVPTSSITMSPKNASNKNCFSSLSLLCQAEVIVAAFYNNHEVNARGQPICFAPQGTNKSNSDIVHQCCTEDLKSGYINCTEDIYLNVWVAYAIVALQAGSAIMFMLMPLLFKYLPTRDSQMIRRSKAGGPKRLGYSSHLAEPIDSLTLPRKLLSLDEPLSFITCGGDEAQPCYSRLCRLIGLFIFPLVFCCFLIIFLLNDKDIKIRTDVTFYTGLVGFLRQAVEYYIFAIVLFAIVVLGVLVIIPDRLSTIGKALSGRKDEKNFLCFPKPEQFIYSRSGKAGFQFLHSNMVFHIKCCFDLGFWLFILKVLFAPCAYFITACCCFSKENESQHSNNSDKDTQLPTVCLIVGCILLPIILVLWMPIVLFALLVYVIPVGYVAFRILHLLYNQDLPVKCECCERLPTCIRIVVVLFLYFFFILFCISVLGSYVLLVLIFGGFFYLIGKIFLYTLAGLCFNVEFYIPYTVLAFFVVFYIWRALSHYFSVYENLRIVLFDECEKYEQQESMNAPKASCSSDSSPSGISQPAACGLLLLDLENKPSIPLNLFVSVYRRLRPRGRTFLTIFMKLLLTLLYLSVAFASIMSLNNAVNTSTYVQALFSCTTFSLPMVLFCGRTSNAKRRKKDLEYQVRFVIHKYVSKVGTPNESTVDQPSSLQPIGGDA